MRVIGIDPGTLTTGYGIVDEADGRLALVAAGSIRTVPAHPLPGRLKRIYDELLSVIRDLRPAAVAVENTFVSKNIQSALKLGQAHGMALLAAETCGLPVHEFSPTQIKQAVVGYGAAAKDQVGVMVGRLLRLAEPLDSHHAADALAVAICHLHSDRFRALVGPLPKTRRRGLRSLKSAAPAVAAWTRSGRRTAG